MKLSPRNTLTGAAAVLLLSAAACSSSGSSPSSGGSGSTGQFGVNATGTVTFWARQATDTVTKPLVAQFNATHKNLQVKLHLTQPNEASTELGTAIRAGSVPDLVGLNDINVPLFMHENTLMNLTKYVNGLSYKSSLSPGHLKLATQGSQHYGVPFLADLSVLWYNKKLFKEAGLNPDTPPSSYAQIVADAKKISAL
ncbi:MAG: ABC transporter substrate-binding protein, partial [Trebonia sp.]